MSAAAGTLRPMDPCPTCGRPFLLGAQPAALLAHSRGKHVAACTGPPRPVGRPTGLPPEVIERIERDYRNGLGLRAIARALSTEGIPTAHGGSWHPQVIKEILLRARRAPLSDLPE